MSEGIEFDEDKFGKPAAPTTSASGGVPNATFGQPNPPANAPKMAQWLMRKGIRSEHAAQAILIGVVIFNFILTFVIVKFLI